MLQLKPKGPVGVSQLNGGLGEMMDFPPTGNNKRKGLEVKVGASNRSFKSFFRDFPGDTVVKNLPANAGDTGLSPGPGRSHMPRSN